MRVLVSVVLVISFALLVEHVGLEIDEDLPSVALKRTIPPPQVLL
jgi:hypothetical protein